MKQLGIPVEFINMTELLFSNAKASVKINGSPSRSFKISRGVRQGCPLAPYFFLISAKILNAMVKREVESKIIKGTRLSIGNKQQIILQYADDTSFTVAIEESMRILVYMINSFCLASSLELNWTKSNAFWKSVVENPKPSWIELIDVTWADDDDVEKLLGSVFGMNLCAQDADKFLKIR